MATAQPTQPPPSPPLVSLGQHPGVFHSDALRDIVIVTWKATVTLDCLPVFDELSAQSRRQFGGRISCIHYILPQVDKLPDAAAREALVEINNRYIDMVAACAIVIASKGFVAGALRGLITALSLRSPGPTAQQTKVVGTPEAAAQWLATVHPERMGTHVTEAEIRAALAELETRYADPQR